MIFMDRKLLFSNKGRRVEEVLSAAWSQHPPCQHMPVSLTMPQECPGDQHLWLGHCVPLLAPRGSRGGGGVGWWGGVMPSMALAMKGHSTPASRDGARSGTCMASSSMQHTALLTWSAAAIKSYI